MGVSSSDFMTIRKDTSLKTRNEGIQQKNNIEIAESPPTVQSPTAGSPRSTKQALYKSDKSDVDYSSFRMSNMLQISECLLKEKSKATNRERKALRQARLSNTRPEGNKFILQQVLKQDRWKYRKAHFQMESEQPAHQIPRN